MKKIFYPLPVYILAALFMLGTVANAQSTYTISFPNSPPPVNDPSLNKNDHNNPPNVPEDAIETGVKFRVTQPGTITGIRFFKGSGVLGVHIGHLWTSTGTQLAEATFSETASGWQEVGVSVHISSGTVYVASVFSNFGDYGAEALTWNGSTDYGTDPIKVIAYNNAPGGNGVYRYLFEATNPTGAFPNADGFASNYWIDVRFLPDFSLPVNLTDFRATPTGNNIVVNWKTGNEYYNRGFEIQRSNNGSDWYPVNFVNSQGDGNTVRNYNYSDQGLAPGVYYYRLKQTDYDGKNTFSSIITATIAGKGKTVLFQNYPNPFAGSTTIRFDLPNTQVIKLSLFDMMGREIRVLANRLSEAGSHQVVLDAANLRKQFYIVRLQTENGVMTRKIMVE